MYLNAMQNRKNPLHDTVKEEKGCRLARGKSYMGQAKQSIQHEFSLAELKQVRDWENVQLSSSPITRLCYQRTQARTAVNGQLEKDNAEVQMLVEANNKPHDIVIYTDGSHASNTVASLPA